MTKSDADVPLIPSVLYRLIGVESSDRVRGASERFQNLREMRESVVRDIENLLNTRVELLNEIPSEFPEVARSIKTYGLPDFSSFDFALDDDLTRVRTAIERAISIFEPRLEQVRVQLDRGSSPNRSRKIHFRIDALLRVEPAPERVTFDAVLELQSQQYEVRA